MLGVPHAVANTNEPLYRLYLSCSSTIHPKNVSKGAVFVWPPRKNAQTRQIHGDTRLLPIPTNIDITFLVVFVRFGRCALCRRSAREGEGGSETEQARAEDAETSDTRR